jgi:hypothetical protein
MLNTQAIPAPTAGVYTAGKAVKTVTGQRLAKATHGYPPWERAKDPARWLRGELTVRPTAKLAAETFGVSVSLVSTAREWVEVFDRGKQHGNNGSATGLSDDQIERIITEVGVERAVDKLTQPQLPLAAAE